MKPTMNKALITGAVSVALLAGCASTSKDLDYKSDAPVIKNSLEIPPDLSAPTQQNRYPLPTASAAAKAAVAAQTSNVQSTQEKTAAVQIERAGTQRWLKVEGQTPAQLWPLLKAFWQDNGFVIQNEEPNIGLMETDWAENRAKLGRDPLRGLLETVGLGSVLSTPERDRFRIRIEQNGNNTEVFFSHRGMYEIYVTEGRGETRWQPRPSDPELEAIFLSRFMVRLGADEKTAESSRKIDAVANVRTESKAQQSGENIVLADNFERSWRRVGLALERQGLAIIDRDRSTGTYFVSPIQDELSKATEPTGGFWSSLTFWKDQNSKNTAPAREQLRVVLSTNGPEQTRISIRPSGDTAIPAKQLQSLQQKLISELQ